MSGFYRVNVDEEGVLLFGEPAAFDLDFSNVIEPDGSTDPGSEDLTLDWGFATVDETNASGSEPEDAPSPGPTAPASLTDTQTIGASEPGVTTVPVTASDDGGVTDGEATVSPPATSAAPAVRASGGGS